eukprot:COSAG02_NODE_5878_length_3967_cov_22.152017_3_plen_115_part_00
MCVLASVHRLSVVVLIGPTLRLRGWCLVPRTHLRSDIVPKAEAVLPGQHALASLAEQPASAASSLDAAGNQQSPAVPDPLARSLRQQPLGRPLDLTQPSTAGAQAALRCDQSAV